MQNFERIYSPEIFTLHKIRVDDFKHVILEYDIYKIKYFKYECIKHNYTQHTYNVIISYMHAIYNYVELYTYIHIYTHLHIPIQKFWRPTVFKLYNSF
jgi:hypothetical protein